MAYTKISDVIIPELFTDYVIDKTTEKSEIMFQIKISFFIRIVFIYFFCYTNNT